MFPKIFTKCTKIVRIIKNGNGPDTYITDDGREWTALPSGCSPIHGMAMGYAGIGFQRDDEICPR